VSDDTFSRDRMSFFMSLGPIQFLYSFSDTMRRWRGHSLQDVDRPLFVSILSSSSCSTLVNQPMGTYPVAIAIPKIVNGTTNPAIADHARGSSKGDLPSRSSFDIQ